MNFRERVDSVVSTIGYKDGYRLVVDQDEHDRVTLQVEVYRPDTFTGEMGYGYGGLAYLHPKQTKGDIIRVALGLFMAYETHEVREWFTYRGKRIYGPHLDPDALFEIADRLDFSPESEQDGLF